MLNGVCQWQPGPGLAWFHIVDQDNYVMEMLYDPTNEEIAEVCRRFDIDPIKILDLIRNKKPEVCGFLVDAQKYKEGEKSK